MFVGTSERSTRSQQSSIFGGRKGFFERTGFTFRQWVFVVFEMFFSYVWFAVQIRWIDITDLNRLGLTLRQGMIDMYLRRACGSFISLLVGYLADTYFNMYSMAILNVILYFLMSTILFMEVIIRLDNYETYQEFFYEFVGILLIPLKATDFTRLVYGLQSFGRKDTKITLLFIFSTVWLNERAVEGLLVTIISYFEVSWQSQARLSFVLSGAALAVYIYVLKFPKDKFEISYGPVGNQFIGCVITAVQTRYRLRAVLTPKMDNWLDYAEIKYNKALVTRARDLLKLYCLILPTIGFSLYTAPKTDFYAVLWERLVPSGMFLATGLVDGVTLITILAMGVVQFAALPLAHYMGLQRRFMSRFIIGYICALICMGYTARVLQSLEEVTPSPSTGMVRIFNARDDPVRLVSQDKSITSFDDVVKPKDHVLLTLDIGEQILFSVMIIFAETKLATYLTAKPDVMIGYVLLNPASVVRMNDKLPVRELAAGMNNPRHPKLYLFNALQSNVTVEFRASSVYQLPVVPGELVVLQVPRGTYQLRTLEFESNGAKYITMESGGFYGIVAHETSLETLLTTDILILKSRLDTAYVLGVCIPYGVAIVLSYVALRGMVFVNTPDGMEGMSFGFLNFLDDVTFWVLWIGHKSWHPFITSYAIWMYCILELILMFCCIFVFIKFSDWYKFQ